MMLLETLAHDVRYGFRQLRRTPVLLSVAVLSLGLGIGANTAIFTLINAVMLQSLPVRDPGRLALFYDGTDTGVYSGDRLRSDIFSYPSWEYLRAHQESFENLCAFRQSSDRVLMHVAGIADSGPREQARAHLVSGNYFDVFGVGAAAGRVLRSEDDTLTAPHVAVISYRLWQNRFHLDSGVIGRSVVLNETAFTVVGVAAPEFFGERIETPPDFWIPLSFQPQIVQRESWLAARDQYWLNLMGRLKPGISLKSAGAAVSIQLQQFYTEQLGAHPPAEKRRELEKVRVRLKPGGGGISGLRFRYSEPLHVLMAVVGVVLLIACANIAMLLLARASARRQEFLARVALGASRARLVRQVLTESIVLAVLGGAAGLALAWWSVKGLVLLLQVNPVLKVKPDLPVLLFAFAVSVVTGVLSGIIPALRSSGTDRVGTRVTRERFGSARALIILQIALSLVLLIGAGLLAHSLAAMERQDLGFHQDNVLLVRTDPRLAGYQPGELLPLYREMDERLNQIPGVVSASIARYTPESGSVSSSNFSIQGYTPSAGKEMSVSDVEVGPRFFETLGIPVLLGRTIGPRDTPASTPVAVVNESFVKTYLPNENPIGRRIYLGVPFKAPGSEIVGVVGDSRYFDVREKPGPMAFFPAWQLQLGPWAWYSGELALRTSQKPSQISSQVRRALANISSKLPILSVSTLDYQIEQTLNQQKMITSLCSIFGGLALLLAVIGIYGTMTYSVAQRTTEIGIRMAVGAQRGNVLWMILRDSVGLTVAGLVIGFPVALMTTRWLRSFLFGVPAADPLAIAAAILVIAVLASVAGYLPARRGTRIDPMLALRHE